MNKLDSKITYADSAPAEADRVLRIAAADLSERGLIGAASWALELAVCARVAAHSASVLDAKASALTSTPARRPVELGKMGHSTPAAPLANAAEAILQGRAAAGRPPPSPLSVSHTASNMIVDADDSVADPGQVDSYHVHFAASADSSHTGSAFPSVSHLSEAAEPGYALAKTYFDDKQYERCAALLRKSPVTRRTQFLRLYAEYLTAERQANEQNLLMAKTRSTRTELGTITEARISILEELIDIDDPFLLYLKGMIFRKLNRRIEAMDTLLKSVQAYPYNWSAWQELGHTISFDEIRYIMDLLPESFMSSLFLEKNSRDALSDSNTNLERIDTLLATFPDSAYLLMAKGQNYTFQQKLEDAERIFGQVFELDPFRMDGIADYAHTLFVLDRYDKLAALSDQFAEIGRDHPEVCCLIGNYYNQRGDHHRAIEAFKRALRLDMGCLAAWILLGHEYLELKNSHAAAEMYRRALDISPNDYRAWHGLGCVYELNGAWSYAAHYFQKCASIRPYDSRMWASLGECYDRLERTQDAISCFKRHLTCQTTQDEIVQAIQRIIDLYERLGQPVPAAYWHRNMVQVVDRTLARPDALPLARFVQSYIVAARWEMGEIVDLNLAAEALQQAGASQDGADAARAEGHVGGRYGNLALADEYLRKVISAKTELTDQAEKLLQQLAYMRD
ncbi:Anaphase-promoting complex subunit 8 [Tilletia horrida]|uniref:Anaphase-promoting complex subunit 8 n=1 Tax=Tilletia horrida TaxID=155126 RepID=A0AAN6JJJ1_9BASI|nr:Anaphase-promoting complex subunit 8 [Tilletia horrida]